MERPAEYYSPDDPTIAPQLSGADLKRMTPEQIVKADELQQFAVLRSGRDPLPMERAGERLARPDEVAAAARAAKAAENKAKQDRLIDAKKEGIL
ncbi:MAG: hypothetical protein KDC40_12325 [Actinobacteria bacterium]|nr:hypothetical protein [Actinomycetota bacterium]MCB0920278.1 hypothetical protein [Actinomycetota bacterium]HRY08343.1 hypothetical protein [Candidatus Nanopelagicales bacterium]